MVYKKHVSKRTRKRKTKRTKSKFAHNIKLVHNFYNNNPSAPKYVNIDDIIVKCNDVLTHNETRCNPTSKNKAPRKYKGKASNTHKSCKKYNKCKQKFSSFMTGHEPKYNPKLWSDPVIEGTHNCYAYFLNDHIPKLKKKCKSICKSKNRCKHKLNECGDFKPQLGDYAENTGLIKSSNRIYTCPEMVRKVSVDNMDPKTKQKYIFPTKFSQKCPPKYYKGALVIKPNKTYHFYRQDNNVRFSHKQGSLRLNNIDASGKPIYAPHLANRNYYNKQKNLGINYTQFCSYLCAPKNSYIKTHAI